MLDTSSVTSGGESSADGSRVSSHILQSLLTIFDCAIVLHRKLRAYLRGKEALIIAVYLKSCFVEEKPIIGSGTNSCFHHRL